MMNTYVKIVKGLDYLRQVTIQLHTKHTNHVSNNNNNNKPKRHIVCRLRNKPALEEWLVLGLGQRSYKMRRTQNHSMVS